MKYKQCHWLHIPTGTRGVTEFNDSHSHEVFLMRGFSVIASDGIPEVHALLLVNKWNVSRDWKYWLE